MTALPKQPPLTDPFRIADVEIANRVLLAPLAGIGNWFVRLQAKRHGAGLAVSEMISSFDLSQTIPEWALAYHFDIVLRGREATPMESS